MIYVTHDEREALSLGKRIALLREGELQQVGMADDFRQRPANQFVADFFAPD
jgi:ABC-type sugar transport system ATPase subunit